MTEKYTRRDFLQNSLAATALGRVEPPRSMAPPAGGRPNVLFIFADQWRAQDAGYAGNSQVHTPQLDRLASQSTNFTNAVSGCPVCSPYRASLLTGQYWLTHGIFYNDKPLAAEAHTMGKIFTAAGYETGYIGKWHLNGHRPGMPYPQSRNEPVPAARRQGFSFWKVRECTHDYLHSYYFDEDDRRQEWPGYDAIAQTRCAQQYLHDHCGENRPPFLLVLSWGPPHDPYQGAPEEFQSLYTDPQKIALRPNVPPEMHDRARKALAGYYAHIAALDFCLGELVRTLAELGLEKNTLLVFTSDHGDMLYSHGQTMKQKPWEESILVPFLLRDPRLPGRSGHRISAPINTPDILPTLLGLCGLPVPSPIEGKDYSRLIRGKGHPPEAAALLCCPVPFHQWSYKNGGREYRGLRTERYTYVRDLRAPWLLFDNQKDPYQQVNLCGQKRYASLQKKLEFDLQKRLRRTGDEFLPGPEYMKRWGYSWDGQDAPAAP